MLTQFNCPHCDKPIYLSKTEEIKSVLDTLDDAMKRLLETIDLEYLSYKTNNETYFSLQDEYTLEEEIGIMVVTDRYGIKKFQVYNNDDNSRMSSALSHHLRQCNDAKLRHPESSVSPDY